ncbi:uncharacterized protein [Miscanthus floridulus]|uniref:uncharacterized protein n=1 Tax=Miscanthus floridulus TaxID=154761 RepID=UPI00345A9184
MVCGSEYILPTDLDYGEPRVRAYNEQGTEASLEDAMDQLDEACDVTLLRSAKYQQALRQYHSHQFIEIAGTGFSTTGKSIRSSRSHSASTVAISSAASSASIVDLVKMVYFRKHQAEAPALAPRKVLKVSTSSTAQWVVEAQAAIQHGAASTRADLKEPVTHGEATKAATEQAEEEEPTPREAEARKLDEVEAPSVDEAIDGEAEAPRTSEAEATEAEASRTTEAEVAEARVHETTKAN